MTAIFFRFALRLFFGVILVLGIHLFTLSQQGLPFWDHFLLPSYGFNIVITLIFFWVLLFISKNKTNQLFQTPIYYFKRVLLSYKYYFRTLTKVKFSRNWIGSDTKGISFEKK